MIQGRLASKPDMMIMAISRTSCAASASAICSERMLLSAIFSWFAERKVRCTSGVKLAKKRLDALIFECRRDWILDTDSQIGSRIDNSRGLRGPTEVSGSGPETPHESHKLSVHMQLITHQCFT
jgi:hypothetical protein